MARQSLTKAARHRRNALTIHGGEASPLTSHRSPLTNHALSDLRPPWRFSVSAASLWLYPFDCAAKIEGMRQFTLEYWKDDRWYVGRLKEMPAVMSQGENLEELQSMIRDAYQLMLEDAADSTFVPKEKQELSISL